MKNVLILAVIYIFLIKKCFSNDAHSSLISILEMNYPIEFTFEQKYQNNKINGWMNKVMRVRMAAAWRKLVQDARVEKEWVIQAIQEQAWMRYTTLEEIRSREEIKEMAKVYKWQEGALRKEVVVEIEMDGRKDMVHRDSIENLVIMKRKKEIYK